MQNLELELDKLAVDPKILASIEQMYEDIKAGKRAEFDARDYYHNRIIDRNFISTKRAWAKKLEITQKLNSLLKKQREQESSNVKKQETRKHPQHIQINGNNIRRIHWGWERY